MQIVSGIGLPLSDEHVLSIDPVLAPEMPNVWLRRMNAFAGRSVSADALTAEQEARAGRIRLRGQSVTAGVVRGLGTTLEAGAAGRGDAMLQVAPGFGLARSGEDISVATPRRLKLRDLPVYARADWLDAVAAGAPVPAPAAPPPGGRGSGGAFAKLATALPRRMASGFGTLIDSAMDPFLPRVAILVAEPVTAELVGRNDPADPCPRDPRDDPYDDWRRIDGCRLSLYLWPADIVALPGTSAPDYSLPPAGLAMRNQLAWRIFQVESGMLADEMHPWEELGVPLAMLGFDAAWSPLFVDRSAVVRLGGLARPRTSPLPRGGTPVLWQAQLLQFVEQLADAGLGAVDADQLAEMVRELPPVGVLPAAVLDPLSRVQKLFPGGYDVRAVPIAAEQIELALRQSASLAPLNLNVPDRVELLVPVPERVYEPGLLRTEAVDPLFGYTVARFMSDRTMWLVRREMVRRRRDVLTAALSGMLPSWRSADPDETASERLATPTQRPPVSAARFRRVVARTDLRAQRFAGARVRLPVSAGDELFAWVRIVPGAASPTGLALGVAPHVAGAAPDFGRAVYWGRPRALPQFATDTPAERRLAGRLPPKGLWTRLSAPAAAIWGADGSSLAGLTLDGVAFTQAGGSVEWGPFGKRDRAGNETVWIADEAPAGASLQAGADAADIQWIDADPADEIPVEDDFGTARIGDSRASGVEDFRGRWAMPFLSEDFVALDDGGLDGFIAALNSRLQVTNDALDLGFARARTDIYRVRQFVLGADAASRLVTSPTLADIAVRDDSARAKSDQIREFVASAFVTSPTRDPENPMRPVPPPPTGAAAPPASPQPPRLVRALASNAFLRTDLLGTSALTPERLTISAPLQVMAAPTVTPEMIAFAKPDTRSTLFTSLQAVRVTQPSFTISDIQSQLPLPGFAERSASVGERLTEPPAVEAYRYALDGKQAVLNSLVRLVQASTTPDPAGRTGRAGIGMGDLQLAGFVVKAGVTPGAGRTAGTLADYVAHPGDYQDGDELTGDVAKRHESDYFMTAVAAIDNAIAMMRLAEGRVDLCGQMLGDARQVRADIAARIDDTDPRLRSIEGQLAEARSDLAAATALLAEEEARVAGVNARRTAVLQQYVTYLAYRRPRTVAREVTAPISPADPAAAEDAVAICMRSHPFVPDELRTMAGLFREAPIRWLPPLWSHLTLLDTADAVLRTAETVQRRAPSVLPFLSQAPPAAAAGARYLAAATTVLAGQRATVSAARSAGVQFDRAAFSQLGVTAARLQLIDLASPADLLDGAHGRAELMRRTGAELDRIAQVAACLYASFSEVLPAMRIGWAELLIGLDGPVNLQSLTALPRWSELSSEQRREQQGLVDWLFSRINAQDSAAVSAANGLIRVAALIACHAPVDQIVGAAVARATPARPGNFLDLSVDLTQVRLGMAVLVRDDAGSLLARAVVEDVGGGLARARISHAADPNLMITSAARVHLTHAL